MEAKADIGAVLAAIVYEAAARDGRLTKLRLVKFLYLLDLYWAQAKRSTFTGWKWAFIHYGPYCRESTDAIDAAVKSGYLAARSLESNFGDEDYRLYEPGSRLTSADAYRVLDALPLHVSTGLRAALRQWHDDTYGLLNFVYFKTGPMKKARPKDVLSFDEESMPDYQSLRPINMLPLSEAKKKAVRDAIGKITLPTSESQDDPKLFDQEYQQFIDQLEGEETPKDFDGIADVDFEEPEDD